MNTSQNFKDTFIAEAEDLLSEIEECVLDIENNPNDMDAINRLFRAMHTIKGSGAMFGFDNLAAFTHHVETALDFVREGKLRVTTRLIDMILSSRDHIKAMLDQEQGGPAVRASRTDELIKIIESLVPHKLKEERTIESIMPSMLPQTPTPNETAFRISVKPHPNIYAFGMDPMLLIDELRGLGESTVSVFTDKVPSIENLEEETCYLYWNVVLFTQYDINAVRDVFIFVEDDCDISIDDITDEIQEVPKIGEILVEKGDTTKDAVAEALRRQTKIGDLLTTSGGVTKEKVKAALKEQKTLEQKKLSTQKESVRVPADKLDHLVNLVGEMVIVQAQLASISGTLQNQKLQTTVEEIERLTGELRDVALSVRMMPIGTTFARFRRLVRDLSNDMNKEINLETIGAETELDKTVLDKLGDPLIHMIRNSIDHGIELPDERIALGKSAQGTIRLSARHRGAKVVISIEDDGKGLNTEVILKKAIEKGLIAPDSELSTREIYNLILQPGFSTAEKVSNVSGRGVGMDVVKKQIDALRGSIEIKSRQGSGTTIELSLPLTLAIIDGLLVEVNSEKFVIPVQTVEECLELTEESKAFKESRNVLQIRGELVPFIRLRDFFGVHAQREGIEEAVVVELEDSKVGLVVDKVLGDHQTVIKSLGHMYRNVTGVSGATIMGDGNVALIIDVPSLTRIANL
ncbi:MAG: chemotaxis protein CheA, partial [Deltaproteobacteria bacterium]|nr:chemotaxis protein CheA [Deltaproteobacteria bacterium]